MDFDGIEHVASAPSAAADTITVDDLTGTDVDTVDVDLSASGGGGDGPADTVIVERHRAGGTSSR